MSSAKRRRPTKDSGTDPGLKGVGLKDVKAAAAQRPKAPASSNRPHQALAGSSDTSQFTLKMRTELHKELARMALENDMTMRGFIMQALKREGLSVTDTDLVDGRKR